MPTQVTSGGSGPRREFARETQDYGEARALLGEVIARARRGRLTLEELAVRAGVSSGILSQIERGAGNPSYTTLLKISRALELPLGSFFSDIPADDAMLVAAGRRKKLVLPDGLTYELLTPDFQRQLAVFRTTVPPGFDDGDYPSTHPGEECIHVLSGQVEVTTGGTKFTLRAGDSLTHDSGLPHCMTNPDRTPAELIISVTPVTF
jgi:transcriptional regulator with XRE-family HTH domain